MRRLLAAAAVLMAGPAMAVDYVKCEAMAKVRDRVFELWKKEAEPVASDIYSRYMLKYCGEIPSGAYAEMDDFRRYRTCIRDTTSTYMSEMNSEQRKDPRLKPLWSRLEKIAADQDKAGCL